MAAPLDREEASAIARLLDALADPTRVLIVSTILHSATGELCGRDLRELLDLRQPTASHHIGKLERAGILVCDERGPYRYFSIAPKAFERIREIFGEPAPMPALAW
jgi:ArsR family transcriptional regulator